MKFSRIKTTAIAGVMAASMLLPGMTAFADESTPAVKYPTLNKTVQVGDGITLPSTDTIKFTATQYDADKQTDGIQNTDKTTQNAIISDTELQIAISALTGVEQSTNKAGSVNVKAIVDKIEATGKNGEYTFEITETAPTDKAAAKYGWSIDTSKYYLHIVRTEKDGTVTYYYYAYKGTDGTEIQDKVGGGDDSSNKGDFGLAFVNSYTKEAGVVPSPDPDKPGEDDKTPEGSLVIAKTVDGDATTTNDYTFTVDFTSSTTETIGESTEYKYVILGANDTVSETTVYNQTWTTSAKTIKLEDGQRAVFENIPAGVGVTVTETQDPNTKSTTVKSAFNGAANYTDDESKLSATGTLGEKSNKIKFVNKVEKTPITGVVTNVAPYITLVVVAVAAVAAYVVMKRRVAR